MRDVDWSFGMLGLLCVLVAWYAARAVLRGRSRHVRVDADGGSLLVSKTVMEFGYWLLDPVATILLRSGVTSNQVTAFSLFPAFGAGIAAANGRLGLACFLSTVASVCDTLDGIVARASGRASDAGEAFDALADRYVEYFLLGGIAVHYRHSLPLCLLAQGATLGAFMVSYTTAKAEALGVAPPRGLMRRAERGIYISVAASMSSVVGSALSESAPLWARELPLVLCLALMCVISNASTGSRLRKIMRAVHVRDAARAMKGGLAIVNSEEIHARNSGIGSAIG